MSTRQNLREEFIVCGAAGYPDPYRCDTLAYARQFALEHSFNHVLKRKVEVTIRSRLVSDYEVVWTNGIEDPRDDKRDRGQ